MEGKHPSPDGFDPVSTMDSKSLLKPDIPLLVVTESPSHGTNVMTAGWWMLAGYEPFRYLLSIGHKTHTYEVIEESPELVLAAPTEEMVEAVTVCGTLSGRDFDKIDYLNLGLAQGTFIEVPLLVDAVGNIECKVDESFEYGENTYYFCEVMAAHVRSGMLDGRVLQPEIRPLAYMGSDYGENGSGKYRYFLDYDTTLSRFQDENVLPEAYEKPD